MRLSIVKNEQEYFLNLPSDFSINLEDYDGAFDFTVAVKGGYSDNFQIPTEGNEDALNYINVLSATNGLYVYAAKLYDVDGLKYVGRLVIEQVEIELAQSTVDANFVTDEYSSIVSDATIAEVCAGTVIELGTTQAEIAQTAAEMCENPNSKVVFPPIHNKVFYGNIDTITDWKFISNHVDSTGASMTMLHNNPLSGSLCRYNLLPSFRWKYIFERCFEYFGYSVTGDEVLNDQSFKAQILLGKKPLDILKNWGMCSFKRSTALTVGTTLTYFSVDAILEAHTYNNLQTTGDTPFRPERTGTYNPYLKLVIGDCTATQIGLLVEPGAVIWFDVAPDSFVNLPTISTFPNTTDYRGAKLVADTGTIEILSGELYFFPDVVQYFNKFMGSFDFKDFLPDKKVSEFLLRTKQEFGIDWTINSVTKKVEVYYVADKFNQLQEAENIGIVSSDIRVKTNEGKRFVWGYDNVKPKLQYLDSIGSFNSIGAAPVGFFFNRAYIVAENNWYSTNYSSWDALGPEINNAQVGDADSEVSIVFNALPMVAKKVSDISDLVGIMPVLEEAWSPEPYEPFEMDFDLISLNYAMVDTSSENSYYPMATPYSYLPNGSQLMYLWNRKPDAQGFSLFNLKLRRWLEFLANPRSYEIDVLNTENLKIEPKKWYRYKGSNYMAMRKETSLSDGERVTTFELKKP